MAIINGTDGDDTLEGTGLSDVIRGLGGNDSIFGYGGDDSLLGGSGSDFLEGERGRDFLSGGGGDDVMFVNVEGGDLADGEESYDGGAGYDSISFAVGNPVSVYGYHDFSAAVFDSVEKLLIIGGGILTAEQITGFQLIEAASLRISNSGRIDFSGIEIYFGDLAMAGGWLSLAGHTEMPNWVVNGSASADTIIGGDTPNRLSGSRGQDVLRGGLAGDTLDDGSQNDTLIGNDGNDLLRGGKGSDRMAGGTGADLFDFNLAFETRVGTLRDVIRDFTSGEDRIDLGDIGDAAGVQLHVQDVPEAEFSGSDGELRTYVLGKLTVLAGDLDGDRIADFEIGLAGAPVITADDLVL